MPAQFKFQAVSDDGATHEGVIVAVSAEHVEEYLSHQNLLPISISEVQDRRPYSLFGLFGGNKYEDLITFTNQLATLYRAGIPLLRALTLIKIGKETGRFNYVIYQLKVGVESGRQLSEIMADYPDLFSRVYIAGVAAGEESGKLDQTLDELAIMLEREMEIARQLKSATRYPMVVVSILVAAAAVMMIYVIPRFIDFYSSFTAQLPLPTRILIGISNFATNYWSLILGLIAAGVFGFRKLVADPQGRRWFDRRLVQLPVFGDLIIKANVARFTLMFRILFRAGLPIIKSIDLLISAIKNTAISAELILLQDLFRKGQDISGSLDKFKYLPEMALQLISIGVESGSLDRTLEEVGNHYSKEVMYRSRQMTSIIEPILTVVLGLFVLVLALAMFLPMWNLIKVFKG
ncbi:MAG: type II secretion system F family protein [candidate division Zixibacteria bacterium]|nr:type II secretion system F family protein [candidate division Zixibacteria bacterium]